MGIYWDLVTFFRKFVERFKLTYNLFPFFPFKIMENRLKLVFSHRMFHLNEWTSDLRGEMPIYQQKDKQNVVYSVVYPYNGIYHLVIERNEVLI